MNKKPFYITTTLPYVNAAPHIGFALELVQADVIARYHRLRGHEVIFNTGTDEHGTKVFEEAKKAGKTPEEYAGENAAKFKALCRALNISTTNFIRTTDPHHVEAAQEFWRRCAASGDIEKKLYKIKYCIGCELEKTDSELEGGRCPLHPHRALEEREEENYFFKFSKHEKKLLELYEKHLEFVLPEARLREIKEFVKNGLNDFSVSRLKKKLPWGVPVPGDSEHVMYVWFDALVNYVSTLGWYKDKKSFEKFWGTAEHPNAVQIAGKDNLRQQSAMWQAMLMSAGLPPSKQILIHGFVTREGKKMSKSVGNVVDPFEVVGRYGIDPVRYYLLREIPSHEDGDFSESRLGERYNADLADGLGNFTARVSTLAEKAGALEQVELDEEVHTAIEKAKEEVDANIQLFKLHEGLGALWGLIRFGDSYVNRNEPWKTGDKAVLFNLVAILDNVAALLSPFLPETAEKITKNISWEGGMLRVKKSEVLFPRLS